ncbi:unnamed protein product [Cylindrotheca closterium]|uniref:Peptidase A1 domain-containing protein n=1 Tax=Cylindrotheca closterium TaxID=2856 RepID=A0AAD2G4V1_9STRA|nr:unnamed protein product [Cylindrotheca closterium]
MTQLHRILEASTLSAAFEVHHSVSRSPLANAELVGNGPNMRRRFATKSLGNPNNEQNPTILPVSNCAGTLYTTNIKIGGQSLQVLVDSGTSDLFVESSSCDESCTSSNNSRYDASESSTFRTANDLGESIHGYDTLTLGDINIPNQVFALASSSIFNISALCYKVGYLGLGLSDTTRYNFPSLLSNLKEQQQITMFSLYLGDHSDYETFMNETTHNLQVVRQRPPVSATSELTFGGVNPKRYKNCLRWHEVGQSPDKGEAFKGYWDFALDEVKVGSTEVPSSRLAMVDSSKNFSAGPQESVGRFAKLLGMTCKAFTDDFEDDERYADADADTDEADGDEEAYEAAKEEIPCNDPFDTTNCVKVFKDVKCDDPRGWDFAYIQCSHSYSMQSLTFVADGNAYHFSPSELFREADTDHGRVCVLQLKGVPGYPGWVLGMDFLRKYYTVFDYGRKRLGFAEATVQSSTVCEADSSYFSRGIPDEAKPAASVTSTSPNHSPTSHEGGLLSGFRFLIRILFAGFFIVGVCLAGVMIVHRQARAPTQGHFPVRTTDPDEEEVAKRWEVELPALTQ